MIHHNGEEKLKEWVNNSPKATENKKNELDDLIIRVKNENCLIEEKHIWQLLKKEPNFNEVYGKNLSTFDECMKEFEKTHCKITNKAIFIKQTPDVNIVMSKQMIKASYEHMVYSIYNKDKDTTETKNFIDYWMRNNPLQRCYEDVGVYPSDITAPSNIYNMWRPFAMEAIETYNKCSDELEIILKHVKIMCNNEDIVYNYIILWIAQMIQFPSVKTICPTLISKQGAGKGTFIHILSKMFGKEKVFETTNPSRDVWGDFNGRMAGTFLINMDELSKKDTVESEGKIKGLITSPSLTINNKGANQYDIQSYHRFIITTNKEEPIKTTTDDRRNLIIRSSDELIGDKDYFEKIYEMLEKPDVVKTCYEYFKSLTEVGEFSKMPIPTTTHQRGLKLLSICPIVNWLTSFTYEHYHDVEILLLCTDMFEHFSKYCQKQELEYKINSTAFGIRLNRLEFNGIVKYGHSKKGTLYKLNIEMLKENLGISNQVMKELTDIDDIE